jgi:hypothetical protein
VNESTILRGRKEAIKKRREKELYKIYCKIIHENINCRRQNYFLKRIHNWVQK